MPLTDAELAVYREKLKCSFGQLDSVFTECLENAHARLSRRGLDDYLSGASLICGIGRGFEPVLVYLEEMPEVAEKLGEGTLSLISETVWTISRTPNGKAIPPFLDTIAEASRRLGSQEHLCRYVDMVLDMMDRTTGSIHGFQETIPSPGLPDLLRQVPYLLNRLSLEGLKNWIDFGVAAYPDHPQRQRDYFSLQTADSRAIVQRERHGALFVDLERKLDLYMMALWRDRGRFIPFSLGFDELRKPLPYYDDLGFRVPDVYDDATGNDGAGVCGVDRYRALLAHMAAHRRWSSAIFADNYSPIQRLAIEVFEDCRVEFLAMRHYPGLAGPWLALHPRPAEGDCDPDIQSCIRHRLTLLSYAILDPDHPYQNPDICEFAGRFRAMMEGDTSTEDAAGLAVSFIARTRIQSDQYADVYFADTEVDYRDDNRHMWKFIDLGDEEDVFDDLHDEPDSNAGQDQGLPPRHYPEWDYGAKAYRPDWVSLYENLHPSGNPAEIDLLLDKNRNLAKRLKRLLDQLKPQQYVRQRYQEDGSELDLDIAIRSLIDFKCGATPDPRINMSHRHDGRDIAVSLLLDLSQSLGTKVPGGKQTRLDLSREAVALLAWAIDRLGDSLAIAGFSSNTRHEVRYQHIMGYGERWDDAVKARLAAIEPGYSTRMGAALRHAGHSLGRRRSDKKLLLVLSDGEPADIDVHDERLLIEDSRKAVRELEQEGVYVYCINLDANADDYVADIFGTRFTVVDHVERLPEKLPKLFMSLTK